MFYYPNVLQRHTGCFSTIWLAATRGSRLVKREYLKVNVVKTCQEILDYVLVRVQSPMPGLPRPRFSLYLSAQLQIGVIRVYFQQCQYLVEDIQHTLDRLHRAQLQIRIDMVDTDLPSLLLPNCLAMMENLEDAPDPFFGLMSVEPCLPGPFDIPQIRHLLESKTPERVPELPPEEPVKLRKPVRTVVSPESITLKEVEPIRMLQIEGEQDLPEVSNQDLDLLMAEEDEAILLEERRQEPKEVPRILEGEIVAPALSPPVPMQVEGAEELLPGQVLRPEEPKPGAWEPGVLLSEVTPPQELHLPAAPSPKWKLLYKQEEGSLSWGAACSTPPPPVTVLGQGDSDLPAEIPGTTANQSSLLGVSGWLPPELLSLWTHCARVPPGMRRPPTEVEEELEAEGKKAETPSEIEVLREAQEPSGPLMLSSELSLEAAEEERSRISLVPPEERWGWTEAEQLEPPALPVVPELPEMLMELPLELPREPALITLEALHRAVALGLQAKQKLDFNSLVPPLSPRKMAARVFYLLLVLCAQQIILMEQEEPYGHILIQPGLKFYQG
ncbi:meiotic recombination protein REC8 homolog isoform 2-T2 [Thomomys bottae]